MRKKNKIDTRGLLFRHKEPIALNLVLVFIVSFIFTSGVLIKYGINTSYLKIYFGLLFFLLLYLYYTIKTILLYSDKIVIIYPMSPFLKNQIFQLKNILSFKLIYGSTYDPSRLIIYLKNKKKKVYYFGGNKNDQSLINKLREMGFEVVIKGNKWK